MQGNGCSSQMPPDPCLQSWIRVIRCAIIESAQCCQHTSLMVSAAEALQIFTAQPALSALVAEYGVAVNEVEGAVVEDPGCDPTSSRIAGAEGNEFLAEMSTS